MSKRDLNSSRSQWIFGRSSSGKFFSARSANGDAGAVMEVNPFRRDWSRLSPVVLEEPVLKKTVDRSSVPKYMHCRRILMQTWCCCMNS
jgi:hypothetical protein